MSSATVDVIIASAQSVAKVYVIGAVGYAATLFPKKAPLLPAKAVGIVARFGFNILIVSLIYSSTAVSITPSSLGDYWFVMVAAFVVLALSYITATILGHCFRIHNKRPRDFAALRISATFPNIVALPILIFPSLCEYKVVYQGFGDDPNGDATEQQKQCVARSNTMIFCYFFSWSLTFYSCGYSQLMAAARMKQPPSQEESQNSDRNNTDVMESSEEADPETDQQVDQHIEQPQSVEPEQAEEAQPSFLDTLRKALKQTLTSPGFLAILAGFVTGCIPPLQSALFDPGGAIRFLGAAIETLGRASSPISTMVVAASLATQQHEQESSATQDRQSEESPDEQEGPEENPIMSDPNFGPYRRRWRRRSSLQRVRQTVRQGSVRLIHAVQPRDSTQFRLLCWFILSRLVVAPAVVVSLLVGLDCGGVLSGVPDLAKLVIVVNSCLPGALVVVVLLKSNEELADTAAAVARVYLPSYLLSIFSIAAWTALGLWITIPDEQGRSICER